VVVIIPITALLCRCRERDFLKKIHECMEREGKVTMVPVTAVLWAQYFFITSSAEATCQLVLQTEESNIKDVLRCEREGKIGRREVVLHCRVLYFCVLFQLFLRC